MTEHRSKMHKDEVSITDGTIRLLLLSRFPQWSEGSLERLSDSGTDSAVYRLGEDTGVRLPRIGWAVTSKGGVGGDSAPQERTIGGLVVRTSRLAPEHGDLVAQGQQLDPIGAL